MEWWQCELSPTQTVWVLRDRNGEFITEYFMSGKDLAQQEQYLAECIANGFVRDTEP